MKQNTNNTYSNRVLQFAKDEDARREREAAKKRKNTPPSPSPITSDSPSPQHNGENPYVKAYSIVFDKLPPWKQREIKEMESNKNTDNRFYADFAKAVRMVGDELSEKV